MGPKTAQPAVGELVGEPERQRQLGPDDRQVDLHVGARSRPAAATSSAAIGTRSATSRDARVARRAVELVAAAGSAAASSRGRARGRRRRRPGLFIRRSSARACALERPRTAMTSTMSSAEQPRDRSCTGRASPWSSGPIGPRAGQPLGQLVGDVAGVEVGEDQHVGAAAPPGSPAPCAAPPPAPARRRPGARRRPRSRRRRCRSSAERRAAPSRPAGARRCPCVEKESSATRGSSPSSTRQLAAAASAMSASCLGRRGRAPRRSRCRSGRGRPGGP